MYLSFFVPQTEWVKCNTQYINKSWPVPLPVTSIPCWPSTRVLSIHPSCLSSQSAFAFCLFLDSELLSHLCSSGLVFTPFFHYWVPVVHYHLCFSGTSGPHHHFGLRPKLQVPAKVHGAPLHCNWWWRHTGFPQACAALPSTALYF